MSTAAAQATVEASFRDEWARIVASLIRRTGDWDLAEESAQEAFAEALRRWPSEGVPRRPGAWLTTVAANRALDRMRRARRGSELLEQIGRDPTLTTEVTMDPDDTVTDIESEPSIEDDRLRLIFTCCHPALALEARVALTLRSVAGLTTAEIARAFLVPEATMAKRLTRAKAKIAGAGIPFRVPPNEVLGERTAGVLAVLYLLFNEGYAASAGEALIRDSLCREAIRLAWLLATLMPDEPEVLGLLALMLLAHARRSARLDPAGDIVTLEEQDRRQWDAAEIEEAQTILRRALNRRTPGSYQLQAAIAACHAEASSSLDTDWPQIAALYDLLLERLPSPVVRLNRAVAIAMVGELDAGLALVDELVSEGTLADYHLVEATRAELHRRRGDRAAAIDAYRRAIGRVSAEPERRFLVRRLAELEAEPNGGASPRPGPRA